jgi:hypothetical protein
VGVALYFFIVSQKKKSTYTSQTVTRGMNGSQGKEITLTCPSGQVISVADAVYVCTSDTSVENASCDPYVSNANAITNGSPYNLNNVDTTTGMQAISSQCNGLGSCTITVPTTNSKVCNGSGCGTGTLQLIGTYNCVQG